MRFRTPLALVGAALTVVACTSNTNGTTTVVTTLPPPDSLRYQLDPSGTPGAPTGILLRWADVVSTALANYTVYSRADTLVAYSPRGITTSNTFHDNGVPSVQYVVTAVDVSGGESRPSAAVTVNERLQLPRSPTLGSVALDSAIFLDWADSAAILDPTRFSVYRVYSTGYNLALNACDSTWFLEGTTVSHEFLAAQLPNGVPQCYATSAISVEGYESLWSPVIEDTPRPDARNVLVWANGVNASLSGFRFWNDLNGNGYPDPGELGLVGSGATATNDFRIDVNASDSSLWLVPLFAGDSLEQYGTIAIADLDSIHTAPATGYSRDSLKAQLGFGYVFKRWQTTTTYYYAALRVTALTHQFVIVDWSIQTNPGNPDLAAPRFATLAASTAPARSAPVRRAGARGGTGIRAR
jgi:hypothetical protein